MIPDGTRGSLAGMTILIVDDNAHMRHLMTTLLGIMGSPTVLEAARASVAARILRRTPVDLMICDWLMGEMSGLDLVRLARRGSGRMLNPLLPIIAVSAYSSDEMARAMYAAGANAVMTKPIGIASFVSVVGRVTERPNAFRDAGTWFGAEHGGGVEVLQLQ